MEKRRKYRINWFRLTILILCGYFLHVLIAQQSQLSSLKHEADVVRKDLQQLESQKKMLLEEKARLGNPEYVEKLAREELGLVRPGEMPYIPAGKK